MDLNDYFDPVSLEKPAIPLIPHDLTFSRKIKIHTADHKIGNVKDYDVAILGVPDDKNAFVKGSASAPDAVRNKLYQLASINRKTKIIDLGNLKISENINDTYYALRDIIIELNEKSVVALIIGGSQDLCHGVDMALNQKNTIYNFLSMDARLDLGFKEKVISSRNYLDTVLSNKNAKFFNYTNIGHQTYFTPDRLKDMVDKKGYESLRLGYVRSNLSFVEPQIRDASFVSLDMSCVRQSDAPGVTLPSPNGFFGQEICQLARYAGAAAELKVFGVFELSPQNDSNEHTAHLAAQTIWYFLDGISIRIKENPQLSGATKFIVTMESAGQDIAFYKSLKTERWWMEIPAINPVTSLNYLISCNYEDYQMASTDEIPERWWKAFHRLV
jgi:arginase family enzyme